jgi:uncharacterized protein YjbI with pentapeptide repeats
MANQEHLDILAQGVGEWNEWRKEGHGPPNLSGAHLDGATLTNADLTNANLIRRGPARRDAERRELELREPDPRESVGDCFRRCNHRLPQTVPAHQV